MKLVDIMPHHDLFCRKAKVRTNPPRGSAQADPVPTGAAGISYVQAIARPASAATAAHPEKPSAHALNEGTRRDMPPRITAKLTDNQSAEPLHSTVPGAAGSPIFRSDPEQPSQLVTSASQHQHHEALLRDKHSNRRSCATPLQPYVREDTVTDADELEGPGTPADSRNAREFASPMPASTASEGLLENASANASLQDNILLPGVLCEAGGLLGQQLEPGSPVASQDGNTARPRSCRKQAIASGPQCSLSGKAPQHANRLRPRTRASIKEVHQPVQAVTGSEPEQDLSQSWLGSEHGVAADDSIAGTTEPDQTLEPAAWSPEVLGPSDGTDRAEPQGSDADGSADELDDIHAAHQPMTASPEHGASGSQPGTQPACSNSQVTALRHLQPKRPGSPLQDYCHEEETRGKRPCLDERSRDGQHGGMSGKTPDDSEGGPEGMHACGNGIADVEAASVPGSAHDDPAGNAEHEQTRLDAQRISSSPPAAQDAPASEIDAQLGNDNLSTSADVASEQQLLPASPSGAVGDAPPASGHGAQPASAHQDVDNQNASGNGTRESNLMELLTAARATGLRMTLDLSSHTLLLAPQ